MAGDPEWEVEEEEGEVEKLELEVRKMCKKISEYRQTTLSSPYPPNVDSGSDPLPSSSKPLTNSAEAEISLVLLGTEEKGCGQKLIQLQETVSGNAASTPILAKRMGECVETIYKLDSSLDTRTIPPAFRRKHRITP